MISLLYNTNNNKPILLCKLKMSLVFKLRNPVPPGLKKNNNWPEMAVIYEFLLQRNGHIYLSREEFDEDMKGYLNLLVEKKKTGGLSEGSDPKLRGGITVDEGKVGTYASGGFLPYGRLEEMVEEKE